MERRLGGSLNAAVARAGYEEKRRGLDSAAGSSGKSKAYGVGLSFFFHGAGFTGAGEAKMKAQRASKSRRRTCASTIGVD